jgi:putative two-component system response regulator
MGAETLRTVQERYSDNEFIGMGIDIAQSHHEHWDGTGYPEGLAGEAIPVCARIAAVADCYDAVRSRRCYKRAFTHEEAYAIILEGSGSHFDPEVVEAFTEIAETYREVWTRMNDEGTGDDSPTWESAMHLWGAERYSAAVRPSQAAAVLANSVRASV